MRHFASCESSFDGYMDFDCYCRTNRWCHTYPDHLADFRNPLNRRPPGCSHFHDSDLQIDDEWMDIPHGQTWVWTNGVYTDVSFSLLCTVQGGKASDPHLRTSHLTKRRNLNPSSYGTNVSEHAQSMTYPGNHLPLWLRKFLDHRLM
jgi:hypothetical protein